MGRKEWCSFNPKASYNPIAKFDKIVEFYLWACPVPGTAYNAKTFEDYNWKTSHEFKILRHQLLDVASPSIQFIGTLRRDLELTLKKHNQYNSRSFTEIIIIVGDKPPVKDIFRNIRNALAHGSFRVNKQQKVDDYFYFFESRNPDNNYKIAARIVLKASTLVKWIKIVEAGYRKI